ncbi:hypothetical protein DVH26_36595 [Paenibacillus sp. H1-7]|uniref:methionyl-tRNA formyltransferase n=1 Tax=Paenibacillus sp. H1-7 TaxID=2282849 RepID=UPI001EF81D4D|nr:formyltransferase family protein [Paenibacillus sp. H1-7]ULL19446.1 hypothetical protein DVH26_36595 [Paenibacillus sp. H1-7]
MRVAAFGRTEYFYKSIKAISDHGHEVVLIGTCPVAPEYTVTEKDFMNLSKELGCPFIFDTNINKNEYINMVQNSNADIAISLNWLSIIGKEMITQFKYGIINAHFGDLPRYKGNATPNWAILQAEHKIVLTLHQMSEELDSGPILIQREYPLKTDTYVADIYRFFDDNVSEMYIQALDGLEKNIIIPRQQVKDPFYSLRCYPRLPRDGKIDWTQSADQIARLVRSVSQPFSGAYTFIEGERMIIWKARADTLPFSTVGVPGQVVERNSRTGEISVLTGFGILVLEEIELTSLGKGKPGNIIKSLRTRLGMDIEDEILALREEIMRLKQLL